MNRMPLKSMEFVAMVGVCAKAAIVFALLTGAGGVLAAPPSRNAPTTHSGKRIVEEPRRDEVVYVNSSEYNRQNKEWSIVGELIGIVELPGSGIAGGHYLDPDNLVELSHHNAELDFSFFKYSSSFTEVRLKHWFGNSFYMNGGLGIRTVSGEATLEPLTGNDDISSSVTASSIGGAIAIGNRWQWEYFTMGCDWIGSFHPVLKTKAKVKNAQGADKDEVEEAEDEANELALESNLMGLRFYLGASF